MNWADNLGTRQCIVCGKKVRGGDETEHLKSNHLGPHYFWFDARKRRTMEPSMTVGQLKKLVRAAQEYPVFEERGAELIGLADGLAVDLTREPHFVAIPPATNAMGG